MIVYHVHYKSHYLYNCAKFYKIRLCVLCCTESHSCAPDTDGRLPIIMDLLLQEQWMRFGRSQQQSSRIGSGRSSSCLGGRRERNINILTHYTASVIVTKDRKWQSGAFQIDGARCAASEMKTHLRYTRNRCRKNGALTARRCHVSLKGYVLIITIFYEFWQFGGGAGKNNCIQLF